MPTTGVARDGAAGRVSARVEISPVLTVVFSVLLFVTLLVVLFSCARDLSCLVNGFLCCLFFLVSGQHQHSASPILGV